MDDITVLIKRIRSRGLAQSEIARRIGVNQPRLSKWEAGKEIGNLNLVFKLQALDAELAMSNPKDVERGM